MKPGYGELEAAELFCARCRRATRVKKRLLLVLAGGDKYDYVCSVCGEVVGAKMDHNAENFRKTR